MNHLIKEVNKLLKNGGFDFAVCDGFAIELFLDKTVRKHGDIDISVFGTNVTISFYICNHLGGKFMNSAEVV